MPISITALAFSDGTLVPMEPGSIVVLVGPNNVGKSRALREVHGHFVPGQPTMAVVTSLDVRKVSDLGEVESWLRQTAHVADRGGMVMVARPNAGELQMPMFLQGWGQGPPFQQIGNFFVLHAATEQRLGLVGSQQAFDPVSQQPTNPLQVLYVDAELEARLSDARSLSSSVRRLAFEISERRRSPSAC